VTGYFKSPIVAFMIVVALVGLAIMGYREHFATPHP
jgi:hypothetical protein